MISADSPTMCMMVAWLNYNSTCSPDRDQEIWSIEANMELTGTWSADEAAHFVPAGRMQSRKAYCKDVEP